MSDNQSTLDELFEALTLVQTHKVTRFPIVLFGTEYWSGLVDWIRGTLERDGKISEGDVNVEEIIDHEKRRGNPKCGRLRIIHLYLATIGDVVNGTNVDVDHGGEEERHLHSISSGPVGRRTN